MDSEVDMLNTNGIWTCSAEYAYDMEVDIDSMIGIWTCRI
jgi:hypothetical protein